MFWGKLLKNSVLRQRTTLQYGYNTVDGEEIYYIPNPALGLWINREKFEA